MEDRPKCPFCKGEMHLHSTYQRIFVCAATRVPLVIRKLRCVSCRKVHAFLPDYVAPYRSHHMVLVQQCSDSNETVGKSSETACCCERTIERWRYRLKLFRDDVISALQGIFRNLFQETRPFDGSSLLTSWMSFGLVSSTACLWGGINILLASSCAKFWL